MEHHLTTPITRDDVHADHLYHGTAILLIAHLLTVPMSITQSILLSKLIVHVNKGIDGTRLVSTAA